MMGNQYGGYWNMNPGSKDHVIALWRKGLSAGQISKELHEKYGPISRNAVIGAIHRMGLNLQDKGRMAPRNGHAHKPKPKPAPQQVKRLPSKTVNVPMMLKRKREHIDASVLKPKEFPALVSDNLTDIPLLKSYTATHLFDIKDDQCRWPVAGNLMFCGAIIEGQPAFKFCPCHLKSAVTKSSRMYQHDRMPNRYHR